jgi:hydroxyacylglutathione hydrolase
MIEILQIDTPSLGDRSYLATDGTVALVVDPQRDIDRVVDLAADRGVRITHVLETHLHNDYLTGGLALAGETGAAYYVSAADQVTFDRVPVSDGDVLEFTPSARVQVLATPGHTFTHLAYVLGGTGGDPVAVFTGGSLLFGATGRTDLLGAAHAAELARAQHASAARLAAALPDQVAVLPTHGFGSFCAATPAASANSSTIGEEKARNPALTRGVDRFVAELVAGLDAYPAYYARMGPGNAAGPDAPDLSLPHQAGPAELRRRVAAGEWLVDLRSRRVFAAGHLAGSLGFELGNTLAPQLGWLLPAGTPVTLLGETAGQVAAAQRELARIGVDRPAAIATGKPEDWAAGEPLDSFPVGDFAALAAARRERPLTVLDVRRNLEWAAGHVDGAVHIPLHELAGRLGEIPRGELWVHCQAGYRAAVAASLLQAAHREVIAIDDEFGRAAEAGLPVVEEPVVEEPVVEEPVVEEPVVEEPVVEEPVVEEPVVEEPVVSEPLAWDPLVQEPVVQDPVVPPPVASKPARLVAAQSSGGRLRTSTVPL